MTDVLSPFRGQKIQIWGQASDSEAYQFATDFGEAFLAAGWVYDNPIITNQIFGVPPTGVKVSVNPAYRTINQPSPAAMALINFLVSVGLLPDPQIDTDQRVQMDEVKFTVDQKPGR